MTQRDTQTERTLTIALAGIMIMKGPSLMIGRWAQAGPGRLPLAVARGERTRRHPGRDGDSPPGLPGTTWNGPPAPGPESSGGCHWQTTALLAAPLAACNFQ